MAEDLVLRKYAHRRLYDTQRQRFVTLSEIALLVKAGAALSARDKSGRDITADVLWRVVLQEQARSNGGPLTSALLRQLICLSASRTRTLLPVYLEHLATLLQKVPRAPDGMVASVAKISRSMPDGKSKEPSKIALANG